MDNSSAKILIVDDTEDNLEILKDILTINGYSVQTARRGDEALRRIRECSPDLILLDILMPGMDGFDVCRHLKADDDTRDIPVIFVSAMTDIESKVRGFKLGGVDYINKPFQLAEILARVNMQITMLRMRRYLERQNAELERLANTDPLTDLYNRRRFFQVAEENFSRAVLCGAPVAITLIDLDHFKLVNDTYGHLVGDQVLIHVARLIRVYCRRYDLAARYGGEEFVILHPTVDSQTAYWITESIRKAVGGTPFLHEMKGIGVTLSAGVVDTKSRTDFTRIDDLLALADVALYRAKEAGRNQVVIYEN